jgi:hypothetical protein
MSAREKNDRENTPKTVISTTRKLELVQEAYELIQDNLIAEEKNGMYIFEIFKCLNPI